MSYLRRISGDTVFTTLIFLILVLPAIWIVLTLPTVLPLFIQQTTQRSMFLLAKTILYGGAVAGASSILGFFLALRFLSLQQRQKFLLGLLGAGAALPPAILVVIVQSLLLIFGNTSGASGWGWAWVVHSLSLVPLATLVAWVALRQGNSNAIEQGLVFRPPWHVVVGILLPTALPVLLVGFLLLFVLAVIDFTIPALFLVTVYSLEIMSVFGETNSSMSALAVALPFVVILGGLCSLLFLLIRNKISQTNLPKAMLPSAVKLYTPWKIFIIDGVILLSVFSAVCSMFVTTARTSLFENITFVAKELGTTMGLGLCVVFLVLGFSYGIFRTLHKRTFPNFFLLLCALPALLPASLVGIFTISLTQTGPLSLLYGTMAMPALVNFFRFAPWGIAVFIAFASHVAKEQEEVALLLEPSWLQRMITISLPLYSPAFLASGSIVFIGVLQELGGTLLVIPPGVGTLMTKLYAYLHYGASGEVAFLGLLCMLIVGGIVVVGMRVVGEKI